MKSEINDMNNNEPQFDKMSEDEIMEFFNKGFGYTESNLKNKIKSNDVPSENIKTDKDVDINDVNDNGLDLDGINLNPEKELTPEQKELIKEFESVEQTNRKKFANQKIQLQEMHDKFATYKEYQSKAPINPRPDKIRTIKQLILSDFEVTISPNLYELEEKNVEMINNGLHWREPKSPLEKAWQEKRTPKEDVETVLAYLNRENYDKFFGILTGACDRRNIMVIDFDVKRLPDIVKQDVLSYINEYLQSDFISNLVAEKKMYIETSLSGGFHFIISVADTSERQSTKLLQFGDFEAICELVGKSHHCVCYPTDGYQKVKNQLYEISSIDPFEYDKLIDFTTNFFTGKDSNIHTNFSSSKGKKSNKSTSNKSTEKKVKYDTNPIDTELKGYQSKFQKDNKDITVITKLLDQIGYTKIVEETPYVYYTHSNSTNRDHNFSLDVVNHCITNFSSNNPHFELDTYCTLRACFILWKSLFQNGDLNQFYDYLKTNFDITLILSFEDIRGILSKSERQFYIHEDGIKEIGVEQNRVQLQRRNRDYIFTLNNFQKPDEKQNCYKNLVDNCTIPKNLNIKYVYGAPNNLQGNFEFDGSQFIYFVKFSEAKKPIQNNQIVTDYFNAIFQSKIAVEFWENWLATFCYYNYWLYENDINARHSLPVCVFKSELRGVGKSDLANLALSVFENHGLPLKAEDLISDFNAELDNRLLFISEAQKLGMKQLNIVKFVGGERSLLINQKGIAKYLVENNLCLIFSSNDEVPLFTKFIEKEQLTENFNQFFVWDFQKNSKYVDNEALYFDNYEDVTNAFPYYVETYLKDVWENRVKPNLKGKRYIIPVPITPAELHMFDSNKTKDDHILEGVVSSLLHSNKNYISPDTLSFFASEHKKDIDWIVNLLVSKKIVKSKKEPRTINGKNYKVLVIDKVARDKIAKTYQLI